jgi:hypothetical protein
LPDTSSTTAMQEYVVPRSIPKTCLMSTDPPLPSPGQA